MFHFVKWWLIIEYRNGEHEDKGQKRPLILDAELEILILKAISWAWYFTLRAQPAATGVVAVGHHQTSCQAPRAQIADGEYSLRALFQLAEK